MLRNDIQKILLLSFYIVNLSAMQRFKPLTGRNGPSVNRKYNFGMKHGKIR